MRWPCFERRQMTISVSRFAEHLQTSGLFTTDEARDAWDRYASSTPFTAESFSAALAQAGRLTSFQVSSLMAEECPVLVFGNYELKDILGQGGMGQVFRAEHRRMGRTVALKVLPPSLTKQPGAVERFQREVKAAARLTHPRIVTAYDADEHRGTHFLVLELVEGQNLHSIIGQRGPMSVAEAVRATRDAAEGLLYAHSQGVIHRDIKPSNLLLGADGVKILDLGLALLTGMRGDNIAAEIEATQLTQTGTVMGTVDYMAPEQAEDTHGVDHRADIYSLGATLHYLLTAHAMYAERTIMQKILAHREKPVPDLIADRHDVPWELNGLFQKLVAKSPAERPQSMQEVLHALHSLPVPAVERLAINLNLPVASGRQGVIVSAGPDDPTLPAPSDPAVGEFADTLASPNTSSTLSSEIGTIAIDEKGSEKPGGTASKQRTFPGWPWLKPLAITLSLFLVTGLGVWLAIRGDSKPDPPGPEAGSPGPVDDAASFVLNALGPVKDKAARESIMALDTDVRDFLAHTTTMPDPESKAVLALIDRIVALRRDYPGTPEAIHAARLQQALPAAVDYLDPKQIDDEELLTLIYELVSSGRLPDRTVLDTVDDLPQPRRDDVSTVLTWPTADNRDDRLAAARRLLHPTLVGLLGDSRWQGWSGLKTADWSPDGNLIVTGETGWRVRCFDATTGRLVRNVFIHGQNVRSVRWFSDSQRVAFTGSQGNVGIADMPSGTILRRWNGHAPCINRGHPSNGGSSAVPVRDDTVLLSFGGDGLLKAWDVETAKELWQVKAHDTGSTMSASLDGNRIVTGDTTGQVRVWKWDSDKAELLHEITGHNLWIDAVAMSPDGRLIASASGTNTLRENDYQRKLIVHDTTTGELAKELSINNRIIALDFSRDGSRLAAGGWAGSGIRKRRLLTWDTESWNLSVLPNGPSTANDVISCVALSPDGKHGFLKGGSTGKVGEIAAGRYLESCKECAAERTSIKQSVVTDDGRRSAAHHSNGRQTV